jgi:hypothetical protein
MFYRVCGAILFIFGSLDIFGYLVRGTPPQMVEKTFATQYGRLISGIAFCVAGLYLIAKRSDKPA